MLEVWKPEPAGARKALFCSLFLFRAVVKTVAEHLDLNDAAAKLQAGLIAGDENIDDLPLDQLSGIHDLVNSAH